MLAFRSVCRSQSLSALAGGVLLLVLPGLVLGLLGVSDAAAVTVTRMLGGMMLALGATLWVVQDAGEDRVRRSVVWGNAACDAALCLVLLIDTLAGVMNGLGYVLAGVFALNSLSWLATRVGD